MQQVPEECDTQQIEPSKAQERYNQPPTLRAFCDLSGARTLAFHRVRIDLRLHGMKRSPRQYLTCVRQQLTYDNN